jgi:hypothetical protein
MAIELHDKMIESLKDNCESEMSQLHEPNEWFRSDLLFQADKTLRKDNILKLLFDNPDIMKQIRVGRFRIPSKFIFYMCVKPHDLQPLELLIVANLLGYN